MTAPQFRDLGEFITEAEPIRLPIHGTVYEFPGSVSGRTGLALTKMLDTATRTAGERDGNAAGRPMDPELVELLNDDQEAGVWDEVFGGADLELVRDGLDNRVIRHVFLTLITWHTAGQEVAVAAWESLGKEATPPNRAARRGSRKASAAAASTTRKPARGSGTRATSPGSGSAGRTSSRAGR